MSSWVQQESPTFFTEPPVSLIPAQQIKKLKARCRLGIGFGLGLGLGLP